MTEQALDQLRQEPHPDDLAVDRFAAKMKAKLEQKRAEGRGGWQTADAHVLSSMLFEHVFKGDPVDVGNLAMMLDQNAQMIGDNPQERGPLALYGTRLGGERCRVATMMEFQVYAAIGMLAQYGIVLDGDIREDGPSLGRAALVKAFTHSPPGDALLLIAETGRKYGLQLYKTAKYDKDRFLRDAWRFGLNEQQAQLFTYNLKEQPLA